LPFLLIRAISVARQTPTSPFRISGDKTVHGRITKEGNRLVRWVMVQAAQNARLHDDRFRMFYERYAERKGHLKAIIAV